MLLYFDIDDDSNAVIGATTRAYQKMLDAEAKNKARK